MLQDLALTSKWKSRKGKLDWNSRKQVIIQADATLHWEQYDIY